MPKDDDWPEYCTVMFCTDPSLRPHHHHIDPQTKLLFAYHCTCGDIAVAGTKPREKK